MSKAVITVEGLGKQYNIGELHRKQQHDTLRDKIALGFKSAKKHLAHRTKTMLGTEKFWALRDVSFEVKQGEVLGVIGKNGAGKSTLLKILCRVTSPTEGKAIIKGRVGSLLEVGTGFHPELTGRENIFLSGAILGLSKAIIQDRISKIIAFSGIERFIDTPTKRYSSGMRVRLGFAVAAHLEPEVLLIDEVLAVGDIEFQQKCLGKMKNVAKEGRTILFVSHNMGLINQLCNRAILLDEGQIVQAGEPSKIVDAYINSSIENDIITKSGKKLLTSRSNDIVLESLVIEGETENGRIYTGKPFRIKLVFNFNCKVINPGIVISVATANGYEQFRVSTEPISGFSSGICSDFVEFSVNFNSCLLTGGEYIVAVGITIPKIEFIIPITEVARFKVQPTDFYSSGYLLTNRVGSVAIPHSWSVERLKDVSGI